ncbi:MAG: beta-ketoacyl synthase N-terminal-like domain-containing protein, partial [Gemmataceae bacterium]
MSDLPRVAVIGLGGLFPDAATPETLWRNILSRHDSSREPPPGRWILPPDQAVSPGEFRVDKVPHSRGCFLDPFTVDLTGLDLPEHLMDELDPVFHLAVEACSRAWKSARTVIRDPRRAGVILGAIALPTEKTSEATRFLLGRTLAERAGSSTLMDRMPARLPHPLNQQVTGLPAKLAARALRFEGPAFTLDAACASSLYAVKLAMDELQSGRVDLMLAGGLSRPDSLYTQMGFAQLRALSPSGRCSPFDVRGDGLMVGEGAGVFVLKRLEDASRDGDSILAVLAGCGLSNDVEGGLLAPASEGQLRAMRAAYALAGWSPDDVDLIECHATGTPIGDAVELQSLRTLWTDCPGEPGRCALGAVKSTVGHLLTGAGAAALTKVLFALREKTLPPTANHDSPLDAMEFGRSPFRIPSGPEPWRRPDNLPRRAAVSAFGFGGINAHLLVEEFDPSATRVSFPVKMSTPEPPVITVTAAEAVLASWSDASLLGLTEPPDKEAPRRWWGLPSADWLQQERGDVATPGYYLSGARLPADRFRIPPREVEEMLPQQVLMLYVAGRALDSANLSEAERLRTGVFLGVS